MSNYSDSAFSEDPNSSWYKVFSYIKPGSRVLDIGCSSGNFGQVLIGEKQCIVDGIELDEADFKIAKTHLRNVYNLNIETDNLDVLTETYDYIYFGDVIEHLVTPAKSLRRIHRLLNKGGQLVFSIPNMAHQLVRLQLLQGDFQYGETGLLDKTHLHFYTTKELERILSEAGFNLVYFDPVLKDLPEEVVAKELNNVGLKLTPEFLKFLRSTEASIYQMVGAADVETAKTTSVPAKLPVSSPIDIFQSYVQNLETDYQTQIDDQKTHIAKLEAYAKENIARYESIIAQKDDELEQLRNHPAVRVAHKISHMTHRKEQ